MNEIKKKFIEGLRQNKPQILTKDLKVRINIGIKFSC